MKFKLIFHFTHLETREGFASLRDFVEKTINESIINRFTQSSQTNRKTRKILILNILVFDLCVKTLRYLREMSFLTGLMNFEKLKESV